MTNQDFNRSLGFLLHDVSRLLRTRFDRKARTLDLTRAQWQVIAHLRRQGGITQSALADILEVEKITLCRMIDRLEGAGWVERRPHPNDRRANCLFLTDQVDPVVDQMRLLSKGLHDEAFDGLTPEDRERLIDTLLHIKNNLLNQEVADENRSTPDLTQDQPPSRMRHK